MHSWVSGRASNPLEIEHKPTNFCEEVLASRLHANMLQSQHSAGLEVSHHTLSLYWFNIKKKKKKRSSGEDRKNGLTHPQSQKSKHRASHMATETEIPTKQKLSSKSSKKTSHCIQSVNKLYLGSSCFFPLFIIFLKYP